MGAYLVDTNSKRYVDYIQGFGAVILGHADPRVAEAIATAAKRGGAVGLRYGSRDFDSPSSSLNVCRRPKGFGS